MPSKAKTIKQTNTKRGIIVIPSRAHNKSESSEGVEETEIAAQISIPEEGGWGWIVVAASFISIFILDGIYFTFGSMFHDIAGDLSTEDGLVALINSISIALYFIGGPLVSALINRFGFRACTMSGSIICAVAYLCSYFCYSYITLLLFYGILGGLGGCLVAMSSGLVVGFYFERLRSLAMALASTGSSVGIMVLFSVNTYIVNLAGWRVATLLHSGLLAMIYFFGMAYRPLLSLTVKKTTEDPTRTVTYLPSLAAIKVSSSRSKREGVVPSAAERLFSAVSNAHFPTAAAVVEEGVEVTLKSQPGPSTAGASRLTITAHGPEGGLGRRQLKQVKSIMSRTSVQDKNKNIPDVTANIERPKSCWARLCHWEEHIPQSRPMYRDDAFYKGRLDQLPAYQKSMVETPGEARTGLEYQMAVSRAVTTADLNERRGIFTTAARRTLATMMDPSLLKKCSFLLLCTSGFFTHLGFLVPYVFLPDRNKSEGIAREHCNIFVSVIGFANALGRLVIGALACKYCPIRLYWMACVIAGISIIAFNFSFNLHYQYVICVFFGFFIASLSSIRSMVIVNLFGLDKLTNATGMMLLFQGLGSLISTPLSSVLQKNFGSDVAFYVAGALVIISGCVLTPVKSINEREKNKDKIDIIPKSPVTPQKIINNSTTQ